MGDTLYQWCEEKKLLHPDLELKCDELYKGDSESDDTGLKQIFTDAVQKALNNNTIKKEISNKITQVADLEKLIEDKNYTTHERRLEELQKLEKKYYLKMVGMIILLVTAILMVIVLIYNFFFLKKK